MTDARQALNEVTTEKQLLASVVKACRDLNLLCYHTFDSRRSQYGFPDLVIVNPRNPLSPVLFVELKRVGRVPTAAQAVWLAALDQRQTRARLDTPATYDELLAVLEQMARPWPDASESPRTS